jgi:hypothetical protein
MKFLAKNLDTGSLLSSNFVDIQKDTNTKFFEPQVGDISIFERNEAEILNAIPEEVVPRTITDRFRAKVKENIEKQNIETIQTLKKGISKKESKNVMLTNEYTPFVLLGIVALIGIYFYTKDEKN